MYVVACDSEVSICGYRIDVRILICRRIAARTGKLGFLLRLICTDQAWFHVLANIPAFTWTRVRAAGSSFERRLLHGPIYTWRNRIGATRSIGIGRHIPIVIPL